jgi:probable rRNA maturation factor
MEPLVETLIEDDRWLALDLPALAERAGRAALAGAGLAAEGFSLCLMACNDARIAALNAEFRGRATPTNVLSWPSEELAGGTPGTAPARPMPFDGDEAWSLGDVALAYDTCLREAAEQGKPLADHACHLIVHGVLHLLGYDHIHDADAALMERIEIGALATLGVANPY